MGIPLRLALLAAVVALGLASCSPEGSETTDDKIVRVSRQNNSGTYHYFREAVLGEEREYKLGSIDQSGSKDVVALVSNTPTAIGYSGMAYATPEVKMLKISRKNGEPAVAPTAEAAQDGSYPIARPLFVYCREEPTGAIKAYLEWVFSAEGQKIVEDIGYVPMKPSVETPSDPGDAEMAIKVEGSDTMVNLAQAWAEAYSKKHPNVKVQVSGGGSGNGIKGLINGTLDLASASRKMKRTEIARAKRRNSVEPLEYIVGKDALAVYVHKENPLNQISIEELAEIYAEGGKIERWSQIDGWSEARFRAEGVRLPGAPGP